MDGLMQDKETTYRELKEALKGIDFNSATGAHSHITTVSLTDPFETSGAGGDAGGCPALLLNSYDRYGKFQSIGQGGVGTVNSCLDPHLGRRVAIKSLNARYRHNKEQRTRFLREARVMSQLEHPNIVPVHELGTRDDGSIYFSMKLIDGITLRDIINGLRSENRFIEETYTLTRLLDIFISVCNAIAFAHSRGVLHRDLKPDNILIGSFGEVLVLDWGLAKIFKGEEAEMIDSDINLDELLDIKHGELTIDGSVSGTPLYMAPEQALGRNSELDERTDEYALGTILYEILSLERPIDGESVREILELIVEGYYPTPRKMAPNRSIPRELEAICLKAMSKRKRDRYRDIRELVADIERYRHGHTVQARPDSVTTSTWKWCKRHALFSASISAVLITILIGLGAVFLIRATRRQALVNLADTRKKNADSLNAQRVAIFKKLDSLRQARISKVASPEEEELRQKLEDINSQTESMYDIALQLYGMSLPMSHNTEHQRMAYFNIYRNKMEYAALTRNYPKIRELLSYSREWLGENFEDAPQSVQLQLARFTDLAAGRGSLQVLSNTEGLQLTLFEQKPDERGVYENVNPKEIGSAPVALTQLRPGSYMLEASKPGLPDVLIPFLLEHAEKQKLQVVMPKAIPAGTAYVHAGSFYKGGPFARQFKKHKRELPGFFMKKHEVTYEEYLKFWLDPDGSNRSDEDVSRIFLVPNDPLRAWDEDGQLIPVLKPYFPIVGISQTSAERYCRWLTAKAGRIYRLPSAEEWEKAARGPDGREFAWGNKYDKSFALSFENEEAHAAVTYWAPPGSFPLDRSVYDIYDLAGNVREWTKSRFSEDSPFYQIKGGSASLTQRFLHAAYASDAPVIPSDVGFRYITPLLKGDLAD